MRAESLQWRPPRSLEVFIATRTIACAAKIFFDDSLCDDPRAPLFGVIVRLQPVATVLDDERFVAAVSSGRSPIAATVAGFSIATIAWLSAGTPHCSNAISDAPVEISFRIPSTNTLAFAAVVTAASSVATCVGVAFSVELSDLGRGSWDGSLPESSSLGGDGSPLRGALIGSGFTRDSRTHWQENFIKFGGLATFSPPSTRGGTVHTGPPKWTILSPPPTRRTPNERNSRG
jgi:hypothetical protein